MNVKLLDGVDVFQSVKIAIISENIALGLYKKKFKNLVDNFSNRLDIAYIGALGFRRQAVVGVEFKSPVHDGWLNEHKPVADLFFVGYKFGGKYWDDKVEDIYPYLSLYMRSSAEKEKFEPYISSYSIEVLSPFVSPLDAETSVIPADAYHEKQEIFEDIDEVDPFSGKTITVKKHTKDIYTFFVMALDRLFEMPNRFFYDFIAAGRIKMNVDVASSGSWLSSFLPVIVIAVSIVLAVYTAGSSMAAASAATSAGASTTAAVGTTLAAEGAVTLGSGALAAGVYDVFGTVGLQIVGAASYASTAYGLYDNFSTLTSLTASPSSVSGGVLSFEKISNTFSIGLGGGFDDFFALPKIDLPVL